MSTQTTPIGRIGESQRAAHAYLTHTGPGGGCCTLIPVRHYGTRTAYDMMSAVNSSDIAHIKWKAPDIVA